MQKSVRLMTVVTWPIYLGLIPVLAFSIDPQIFQPLASLAGTAVAYLLIRFYREFKKKAKEEKGKFDRVDAVASKLEKKIKDVPSIHELNEEHCKQAKYISRLQTLLLETLIARDDSKRSQGECEKTIARQEKEILELKKKLEDVLYKDRDKGADI